MKQKIGMLFLSCLLFISPVFGLQNSASAVDSIVTISQVSAGYKHSCAINSQRHLACWGENNGNQSTVPSDLGIVKAVSAAGDFTCVIDNTDTVQCWGRSVYGAEIVPADLGTVESISAGASHVCAVTKSHFVKCWGSNDATQIDVPRNLGQVSQVSVGISHSCALTVSKQVKCWGAKSLRAMPTKLGLSKIISAGGGFTCSVSIQGSVSCWGTNNNGELNAPKGLGAVKQLSAGYQHVCALTVENEVICWGANNYGQGNDIHESENIVSVSAGGFHNCIQFESGLVRCWGSNDFNQASSPDFPNLAYSVIAISSGSGKNCQINSLKSLLCWGRPSETPSDLGTITAIETDRFGTNASCAITTAKSVRCWGAEYLPQNNVPSELADVVQITVGNSHSCALTASGFARCWGHNFAGVSTIPSDSGTIKQIVAGQSNTCVLNTLGTVKCWGGSSQNTNINTVPTNMGEVKEIAVGSTHACALNVLGLVKCWGSTDYSKTAAPQNLGVVTAISAGGGHTCALKSSGGIQCWGVLWANSEPVPDIAGQVQSFSVGKDGSCAVLLNGSATCWGSNVNGELAVPTSGISVPNLPQARLANHGSGLIIENLNLESLINPEKFGTMTSSVKNSATGDLICETITESCEIPEALMGSIYTVEVTSRNEAGQSLTLMTESFKNCPDNPSISTTVSPENPKAGKTAEISGLIHNFCSPTPKVITFREKPAGKAWGSWKEFPIHSGGYFSIRKTFDRPTYFQIKAKNGSQTVSAEGGYVDAQPEMTSFSVTAKSSYTRQGFSQGGTLTFRVQTSKNFTGTCAMSGQTDYAFNFALTLVGEEYRFGTFKIYNGTGTGRLQMRWNGTVAAGISCSSPTFPGNDLVAVKNVVLRANF